MRYIQKIRNRHEMFFRSGASKAWQYRRQHLIALQTKLEHEWSQIANALNADLNKGMCESYVSEHLLVKNELKFMLKNGEQWSKPETVHKSMGTIFSKSYKQREPIGTVLIYVPWNYPYQLALVPLIDAIAAGNTVILYLSPLSPHTNKIIKTIIRSVFNENYVKVLTPHDVPYHEILIPKYDYIFFTGSERVGKIVAQEAAKTLTPITLELGGKNPCIVDETAKVKVAALRICRGKFMNAGQTCIAPDYILVHQSIKKQLISTIINTIKHTYPNGINNDLLPKIVSQVHFERLQSMVKSHRIIHGGESNKDKSLIAPTLVDVKNFNSRLMQEEIFGPILPIIAFDKIERVISRLQKLPKPLSLYIFSESKSHINQISEQVTSGGLCINDTIMHVTNPYLPFGGIGSSGMGSYHGLDGFNTFSHMRSVVKTSTRIDIKKIMYPPWSNKKLKLLKRIS